MIRLRIGILLERPCECGIEPPGSINHGVIVITSSSAMFNSSAGDDVLELSRTSLKWISLNKITDRI